MVIYVLLLKFSAILQCIVVQIGLVVSQFVNPGCLCEMSPKLLVEVIVPLLAILKLLSLFVH